MPGTFDDILAQQLAAYMPNREGLQAARGQARDIAAINANVRDRGIVSEAYPYDKHMRDAAANKAGRSAQAPTSRQATSSNSAPSRGGSQGTTKTNTQADNISEKITTGDEGDSSVPTPTARPDTAIADTGTGATSPWGLLIAAALGGTLGGAGAKYARDIAKSVPDAEGLRGMNYNLSDVSQVTPMAPPEATLTMPPDVPTNVVDPNLPVAMQPVQSAVPDVSAELMKLYGTIPASVLAGKNTPVPERNPNASGGSRAKKVKESSAPTRVKTKTKTRPRV